MKSLTHIKMEEDNPEYFYRLIRLVVDLGAEVLLKVFKSEINVSNKVSIEGFLKSKESKIKGLKKRKILNDKQLETLNQTNFDETKLDISLLYTLLRNLTDIQEPNTGWDACPLPSDMSPGALLTRLKCVRNEAIAHRAKGSLKKSEFEKFWKEASLCLVELAGEISSNEKLEVQKKVDNCKTQRLLREDEFKFDALLKWEFEEKVSVLESKLDVLVGKVSKQGRVTEDMMSSLTEIQDHMKKLSVGDDSTGTSSLVKPREQDIQVGQLKQLIEQTQRCLDELISQKTWYVHLPWGLPVMMGEPHPTVEDPIDNPHALTTDEIIEYSEELGSDWEIFAIYLGYKQSQIDRLKDTYHRQIGSLLRVMIQKWHDVVARRDENPKKLLAAAFIRNRDNRTAVKILGNRELLTEVKKLKPKDETAKSIHKISFGGSSGITYNFGGQNSVNIFPGSVFHNTGTISTPSLSFGQTHTNNLHQTTYNMGQQVGHQQAQSSISLGAGYGHTTPYSGNPHNMCRGEAVGDEMDEN